jgi:hypothetical protein
MALGLDGAGISSLSHRNGHGRKVLEAKIETRFQFLEGAGVTINLPFMSIDKWGAGI